MIGEGITDDKEAIVRAQFEAFRDRRWEDSEALLAADFTFTSPYDDAISRDAFFERCWPNGDRFEDLRIERVATDANGAYVTYLVTTDTGEQFRNTEYLTVSDGQIRAVEVYFGPSYRAGAFVAKQPEQG
ncbi:nuclear transport factor 2 family protein [Sphingomonas sp. ZT3P38]|uniref:nuclear transport factor 2 family protein n=1 Tax=Parasphingomonas zepuensis TaxID=3096161 RepID=UPI002FC5AAA2